MNINIDKNLLNKMIKSPKEDLIQWLIEMYENEDRLKAIIRLYEDACGTTSKECYKEIDGKHYIKNTYEVHINGKYFTYNEYDATREKGQFC